MYPHVGANVKNFMDSRVRIRLIKEYWKGWKNKRNFWNNSANSESRVHGKGEHIAMNSRQYEIVYTYYNEGRSKENEMMWRIRTEISVEESPRSVYNKTSQTVYFGGTSLDDRNDIVNMTCETDRNSSTKEFHTHSDLMKILFFPPSNSHTRIQ